MAQQRATFALVEPARVRQVLIDVLAERGYQATCPSDWSVEAVKGSMSRNVLLGGFGQRMDLRFDLFADPVSGVIVDAGVHEQASALVLGGAVGAMRTGSEISAILAAVHEELDGGRR